MPSSAIFTRAQSLLDSIMKMITLWLLTRERSINQIREMADGLDRVKNNVNIAKLTGASTGIGGVSLLFAGALASILTRGVAAPFLIGAGVAGAVGGGLVTGGAEVVRLVNGKLDHEKVKKVLIEDQSKEEKIDKEMEELQDLMNTVRQEENSAEENTLIDSLLTKFKYRVNRRDAAYLLRDFIKVKDFSFLQSPIPSLIQVFGALGISRAMAGWVSLAARYVVRGAIAVFTPIVTIIDVYQLVTTAKDVHHGSRSELSQRLRKIANELEANLNAYEGLLKNLRVCFLADEHNSRKHTIKQLCTY